MTKTNASTSEDNGIALLTDMDLMVYSVGISTGGQAEIRMAKLNPSRQIIASTVDELGVQEAKAHIVKDGFTGQINVKLEDVSKTLPYADNYFDFIYARLVLHYLDKKELKNALTELYRILKTDGKIFVVVRSDKCPDAHLPSSKYGVASGLTSYRRLNPRTGRVIMHRRYFHTEKSISEFIKQAGFKINHMKSYEERLFRDFLRKQQSRHKDYVIEVLAQK